ncbi:hypothetical protein Smp_130270.1 [Schistosoma mansoni]|uniref:hypothetical protein n=1 Tax=Schistosoma mansoni TaxID=6183 RepID=UPI00022DC828|nr:hypothetical protein Smp_130270.1 [Schistosoma mansoni]|eukprot:XP_018651561.1 hypothetical protein Smp_130270.1 [Schistosoma mansoni]
MLVDESQKLLNELISDFGWTHEFLSYPVEYGRCSYSQNHWVPVKSLTTHNHYCSLRQQGFAKEEIDAMIPDASICTAECTQPTSDWTNDPSWIMNMQAFSTDKSHRSSNNSSQDVSKLEVLSMMRDAKRRRQSYRGIHTARKSYTEVLREIIAQQTEILTASQELSEQQSEDRRSSVESLSNKPENLHKSRCSHKYKTQNPSRIHRYSPSNSPSSSSSSTTTTRRNNETCRKTSKSTLKHTHHHSSKWNDKRQSSPSSSSKHRTSSKEMNKRSHHDSVDIHDNDEVDSPLHKKLKKHKKHSKHKHKHKNSIHLSSNSGVGLYTKSTVP